MAYQTIKVNKDLSTQFKEAVASRDEKVNTVFRAFMIDFIQKADKPGE